VRWLRLRTEAEVLLVAVLVVPLAVTPVYANVDSVGVFPSVLVVGAPITFFGTVSGSSMNDQIGVFVYSGSNCPANMVIASTYILPRNVTYTIANATVADYNVTLAFPVPSSGGWNVRLGFQTGLPAGPYSVGVQDVTVGAGLCRNFTVASAAVPEFSEASATILLAFVVALCFVARKRTPHAKSSASAG
jgi:hypothetical protein